jgi:hypothetical protein
MTSRPIYWHLACEILLIGRKKYKYLPLTDYRFTFYLTCSPGEFITTAHFESGTTMRQERAEFSTIEEAIKWCERWIP